MLDMATKTLNPWVAVVLVLVLGGAGFMLVDTVERRSSEKQAAIETLEHLSGVRYALDNAVNSIMLVAEGLALNYKIHGFVVDDDVETYALSLMSRDRKLQSIGISDRWVVRHVFPRAGNEKAIGLNYLESPTQRDATVRAVRNRRAIFAGPVTLVQGGEAFIGRIPLFAGADDLEFQGIVGLVVNTKQLLEDAKLLHPSGMVDVAIRGHDGLGADGRVFAGDPKVFDQNPIIQNITIPGGSWQIAGVPSAAYLDDLEMAGWLARGLSIFVIILMAVTAYFIARYINQQHRTIDYQNRTQDQIQHLSTHDDLTGLANRALLTEDLHLSIAGAKRDHSSLAVLFLDIDNFMDVNDSLGHQWGDRLLVQVAERLREVTPEAGLVARLGGDEFAVILDPIKHPEEAAEVAQRLIAAFAPAFILSDKSVDVSVSIGITLYPGDGQNSDDLLRNADLAMYNAKESAGSRFSFFEPDMNHRVQERRALEADIAEAILNQSFQLVYQPKIDPKTETVKGFEALIRWHHPQRGWVSPQDLINAAERSGQILQLGQWVLYEACRQTVSWRQAGFKGLHISVNLSPVQFLEEDLPGLISQALTKHHMDPKCLDMEITEGAIMQDVEGAAHALAQIRALGVSVSVDDFGTGYSSLGYLRQFPVDRIKIDTSFTRDIGKMSGVEAIIETVVSLGRALDVELTVEGVETKDQLEFVRGLGVEEVQGYFYSKPLNPDDVPEFLMRYAVAQSA